jgi:uncharacterized protein YfiM (DUF2279 family)
MKTLLKSSILLLFFSFSLLVFNLSCKKESTAQNTSTSIQNLGILVFTKVNGKVNEFWTSKYDGSGQTKITISSLPANGEIAHESIKISPDGKKFFFFVFFISTNTSSAIYSCNSDGTGLTKVADDIDQLSDVK